MTIDTYEQEVKVATVIAACSPETRRIARMWLYYTLFYWLFPTLAVVFSYVLANQRIKLLDLLIHGEFLIYAITIVAGSTRLIAKDIPKRAPFVSRQVFNLVSHVMIFPAIVAYALLRFLGAVSSNGYSVNSTVVVVYSVLLLIAAFRFSYVVFLIDAQRSTPEELPKRAAAAIARTPDKLKAEFRTIQNEDINAVATEVETDEIDEQTEELEAAATAEEEQERKGAPPVVTLSEPTVATDHPQPIAKKEQEEQ